MPGGRNSRSLRSWNESFGLQLFGDLNRLQLRLEAGRIEVQSNLSSEVQVPVDRQTDRIELGFGVDFWGPFSLFGTAGENRLRHSGRAAEEQVPGLELATLDSDTEHLRGGLGYTLSNGLRIGLGIEAKDTSFLIDPGGTVQHRTRAPAHAGLRGHAPGPGIFDAVRRDIEFDGRQSGVDRRQTSGRGRVQWKFTEKLSAVLFGGVQLGRLVPGQ